MKKTVVSALAAAVLALTCAGCSSQSGTPAPEASATHSHDHHDHSAHASASATEEANKDADVTGINEIEVGDSGPQTNGPLTLSLVYFQAVDMEHGSMAMPPASESDMHFEVDVKTTEKATEWGYEADQFLPYLKINVVVTDQETGKETDLGTMMPMIASDGPHYGNNIKLAPGKYDVKVTVQSPADDFMLHTGKDSSGVKGRFWEEPLVFEFKNWNWDGQLI